MINRQGGMRGVSGLCPAGYIWNGEFCEPELEFHPGEGPIGRYRMGMRVARKNGDCGCGGQARPNPGGCGCGGHAKMNGSDITPLATLGIVVGLGSLFYMMSRFNREDLSEDP